MANSAEVICKTIQEGQKPITYSWTPCEGRLDRNKGGTLYFEVNAEDAARFLDKKVNVLFLMFDMEEMDQIASIIDSESEK